MNCSYVTVISLKKQEMKGSLNVLTWKWHCLSYFMMYKATKVPIAACISHNNKATLKVQIFL